MKTKKDGLDKACRAYYQIHSGFFCHFFPWLIFSWKWHVSNGFCLVYSEYVENKINPEVEIFTTFFETVQKKINKNPQSKKQIMQ